MADVQVPRGTSPVVFRSNRMDIYAGSHLLSRVGGRRRVSESPNPPAKRSRAAGLTSPSSQETVAIALRAMTPVSAPRRRRRILRAARGMGMGAIGGGR